MRTLRVVGGGGGHGVGGPLLGVVVAVLRVLAGGVAGAAADHRAPKEAEDRSHPARVQGEAKGHEALLVVGTDGEPHGRHDTARRCGEMHRRDLRQSPDTGIHICLPYISIYRARCLPKYFGLSAAVKITAAMC